MPSQTEKLGSWRIFETDESVAEHVAEWLCDLVCARDDEFAICLSGGSTPRRLYMRLACPTFASRVPWHRIHWFWGDERFVPHDDAASNYRMAYDALFSCVPIFQKTTSIQFRQKACPRSKRPQVIKRCSNTFTAIRALTRIDPFSM